MYCPRCRTKWQAGDEFCTSCGRDLRNLVKAPKAVEPFKVAKPQTAEKPQRRVPKLSDYSMKWYYFLIYGLLIANAIGYFIDAVVGTVQLFSIGSMLDAFSSGGWSIFFQLCLIVCWCCLGGMALATRARLKNLVVDAPSRLTRYFVTCIIVGIAQMIFQLSSVSSELEDMLTGGLTKNLLIATYVISLLWNIICACASSGYFDKRYALFRNKV